MVFVVATILTALSIILLVSRPYYGFLLVIASKPIIDATWDVSFGAFNLLKIIAVLMPLLLLPRILGRPIWKKPEYKLWMQLGFLYLASQILSPIIIFTSDPLVGMESTFRVLNGLLGFVLLPFYATNDKRLKQILLAIIVAGVFPILVSVYADVTGTVWRARQSAGLVRNIGMYHDAVSIRHFGLQSLLAVLMYVELFRPKKLLTIVAISVYSLGAAFMLYKGYLRGAMVTVGAWFLIWSILHKKLHWGGAMIVGVVAYQFIVSGNLGEELQQMFYKEIDAYSGASDNRKIMNGRFFIWTEQYEIWAEQGAFSLFFGGSRIGGGTHNEVLRFLIGNGIFGLILYLVVIGTLSMRVIGRFFSLKHGSKITVYAMMALAMYFVEALGATPSLYPQYQWFIFGIIGVCMVRERSPSERKATTPVRIRQNGGPQRQMSQIVK